MGAVAVAMGAWRLGRTWPRLAVFLAFFAVPAWFLPMVYLQGGEYDFWFLPLYMAMFVVVGVGLYQLAGIVPRPLVAVPLLGALALAPPLYVNVPLLDRRHDFVALDFGLNLYRHVAKGGSSSPRRTRSVPSRTRWRPMGTAPT